MEIDKEFIDNNTFEEDVNFYRTIDCKKSRFDCTQVGKLILESDDSDDDDDLPKAYKHIYGTDNYEWNNYKRPNDSDILEFGEENYFLSNFLKSPWIPSNDNKAIFGFSGTMLSTSKQHRKNRKKKQALDGLYWSVFYIH